MHNPSGNDISTNHYRPKRQDRGLRLTQKSLFRVTWESFWEILRFPRKFSLNPQHPHHLNNLCKRSTCNGKGIYFVTMKWMTQISFQDFLGIWETFQEWTSLCTKYGHGWLTMATVGWLRNFVKKCCHHFWLIFFQISGIFPTCFGCFLPANATNKKSLNYRNFSQPFLHNIQSLETWNLRDRDSQKWVSRLHHWFLPNTFALDNSVETTY